MKLNPGGTNSPWTLGDLTAQLTPLDVDLQTDVCVVGGGISGMTTAYLLACAGRSVVVLDDKSIGAGETGRTTAHLSNAFDDRYRKKFVMDIVIEEIANSEDVAAMFEVWKEVFEHEMGITLPQDSTPGNISHWLARLKQSRQAVGTLSVVDTSDQHQLHESLGLGFDPQARAARFTHLAVLKPFRGINIPLAMMLEAHRRVIVPGQFDYTWLLFNVEKAATSFLAQQLGFTLLSQTFVSEYGCRCPLVRHERTPGAVRAISKAESYLKRWNIEVARVPFAISA